MLINWVSACIYRTTSIPLSLGYALDKPSLTLLKRIHAYKKTFRITGPLLNKKHACLLTNKLHILHTTFTFHFTTNSHHKDEQIISGTDSSPIHSSDCTSVFRYAWLLQPSAALPYDKQAVTILLEKCTRTVEALLPWIRVAEWYQYHVHIPLSFRVSVWWANQTALQSSFLFDEQHHAHWFCKEAHAFQDFQAFEWCHHCPGSFQRFASVLKWLRAIGN